MLHTHSLQVYKAMSSVHMWWVVLFVEAVTVSTGLAIEYCHVQCKGPDDAVSSH